MRNLVFDAGRLVVATDVAAVAVDARTAAVTTLAETPPAMTLDLAHDGGWIGGATVGDTGGVSRVPCGGGALAWLHRGGAARVAARDGQVVFAGDAALGGRRVVGEGEELQGVRAARASATTLSLTGACGPRRGPARACP